MIWPHRELTGDGQALKLNGPNGSPEFNEENIHAPEHQTTEPDNDSGVRDNTGPVEVAEAPSSPTPCCPTRMRRPRERLWFVQKY